MIDVSPWFYSAIIIAIFLAYVRSESKRGK